MIIREEPSKRVMVANATITNNFSSEWSCTQFLIEEKRLRLYSCVHALLLLKINWPASAGCSQGRAAWSLIGVKMPFYYSLPTTAQHTVREGSYHDAPGNQAILSANSRLSDS